MLLFLKRMVLWLAAIVVALFWSSFLVLAFTASVGQVRQATTTARSAAHLVGLLICLVVVPLGVYFMARWWSMRANAGKTRALRFCLAVLSAAPALYYGLCLRRVPEAFPAAVVFCIPLGLLWAFVMLTFLCRVHRVDQHAWLRTALVLLTTTVLVLYLIHDEPARPPKYTWADIPTPTNAIDSDAVFSQLAHSPARVQLPRGMYFTHDYQATNYATQIEDAWRSSADVHAAVALLNTFDGPAYARTNRFNYNSDSAEQCRKIVQLYTWYAQLMAMQGYQGEAVTALVKVHTLTRKHLRWSRAVWDKLTWISAANMIGQTAYLVARQETMPDQELEKLQAAFTPFEPWEVSMNWPIIGEQLQVQDRLMKTTQTLPAVMRHMASLYLNRNATLHKLEQRMDELMAATDRVPASLPALPPRPPPRGFRIKNPIGRLMNRAANYEFLLQQGDQLKIHRDLLAIYLGFRLRQPPSIGNYLEPGEYPIDEKTGLPFSPGFDGKVGTRDDICLEKSPR